MLERERLARGRLRPPGRRFASQPPDRGSVARGVTLSEAGDRKPDQSARHDDRLLTIVIAYRNNLPVGSEACFEALADRTRRRVVELLCEGPQRAGKLAESTGMSPAAMSRHLRVLLEHGLVRDDRPAEDARARLFSLRPEPFVSLQAWLDQVQAHWTEQLGSFKAHAETQTQ